MNTKSLALGSLLATLLIVAVAASRPGATIVRWLTLQGDADGGFNSLTNLNGLSVSNIYVGGFSGPGTNQFGGGGGGGGITLDDATNVVLNYGDTLFQARSANLTNWSGLSTNLLSGKAATNNVSGTTGKFTPDGTNDILAIVGAGVTVTATNAIANTNGVGAGTRLVNAVSIDVTNLTAKTNFTTTAYVKDSYITNLNILNDVNFTGRNSTNVGYLIFNSGSTFGQPAGVLSMSGERNGGGVGGVNIGYDNGQIYNETFTTVIGGTANDIGALQTGSIILGGVNNLLGQAGGSAQCDYSTIIGGTKNVINGNASISYTFGSYNSIQAVGNADRSYAFGSSNNITHSSVMMFNAGGALSSAKANTFIVSGMQVGIGTTDPSTNALRIIGSTDSSEGFYIKGVPIGTVPNVVATNPPTATNNAPTFDAATVAYFSGCDATISTNFNGYSRSTFFSTLPNYYQYNPMPAGSTVRSVPVYSYVVDPNLSSPGQIYYMQRLDGYQYTVYTPNPTTTSTNAPATSLQALTAVNNLVLNLKAASLWNRLTNYAVYPFAGSTLGCSGGNLVGTNYPITFTGSISNTPIGVSNVSGYATSTFVPAQATNLSLVTFVTSPGTSPTNYLISAFDSTNFLALAQNQTTNLYEAVAVTNLAKQIFTSDTNGNLFTVSRTNGTAEFGYINGTNFFSRTVATNAFPGSNIVLFAQSPGFNVASNLALGFALIGPGFSSNELQTLSGIVYQYLDEMGRFPGQTFSTNTLPSTSPYLFGGPGGNFDGSSLTNLQSTNVVVVINGSVAASFHLGEVIESTLANASHVSLATSGTTYNITSISLTAGDWDVTGIVNYAGTFSGTILMSAGISTTSATLPNDYETSFTQPASGVSSASSCIPKSVINVSSTTTVYLVSKPAFTTGTYFGYGKITARRVR